MRAASVIRSNARDRISVDSLAACRRDELAVLVPTADAVPVSNLRALALSLAVIKIPQLPQKPAGLLTILLNLMARVLIVLGFIDGLFPGTVLPGHGLLLRSTWSAVRTVPRKLCERVSVHTYDEGCTEAIASTTLVYGDCIDYAEDKT